MRNTRLLVAALLSLPLFGALGCDDSEAEGVLADGASEISNDAAITVADAGDGESSLAADLSQLREEEKLARDVYITLYDKWGTSIFQNISRSEQSHMDSVGGLLQSFGIADPIIDDRVGVFVDTDLATLYTNLVAQGMQSQADALQVGATIEDLDIFDIRAMRTRTDDAMVIEVYDLLECGSNNHMRSFGGQIENQGGNYSAQFLTQTEVDSILSSGREQCGG